MIDIQQLTSLISAFRVENEKTAIKRVGWFYNLASYFFLDH